ncbi:MAG: peptidylprolyl isomerase [Planctomycetaceae bacterium]|nr:peptidylprolyl isomerase [Planctomycetaceae bacterium]
MKCIRSNCGRLSLLLLMVGSCSRADAETPSSARILVQVNDRTVTETDLETACLVRGIPQDRRASLRSPLLERLADESLVAAFLERQKIAANAVVLEQQVDSLLALIRRRGEEPDAVLARLGLNVETIRAQLSLPLAWESYAQTVITSEEIQAAFESRRRELDGTQLRARHIVIKVPASSTQPWEAAERRLHKIRAEILAGTRSFDDAAMEFSEGPSRTRGGDVGHFPFRGTMPPAFADAAFRLKKGELSQPVRTNVGVHLIEVTDERPGQLNAEDVRQLVFKQLADQLWAKRVEQERSQARITWKEPRDRKPEL